MYDELLPTLNLPKEELVKFANDVMERFRNPFVKHFVTSIMLNSFPKFKTRDLPGLKTYLERKGELPKGIVLGLAAICTYYKGGKRGDVDIVPNDDPKIIELLQNLWATGDVRKVAEGVLADDFIWGEDLNTIPGLTDLLTADLALIQAKDGGRRHTQKKLMTNWRWWLCSLLFVATTVNYLDRQVLSLTYEEFIKPEFHWTDANYGTITSLFSIFYAIACLFAGKFVDWMGTKKGYLIAIGVWSAGAVMHAACGWATAHRGRRGLRGGHACRGSGQQGRPGRVHDFRVPLPPVPGHPGPG